MSNSVQTAAAPQSLQQLVDGITARLAQLAKDPPDLLAYLRVHAESIASVFHPSGCAYEMRNGPVFQRVLQANLESLQLKELPEQESVFRRALYVVAERKGPVLLLPQTQGHAPSHGLAAEDSPAPDELPLFNRTAFEQHFIPIPLGKNVAGVLHIWFAPGTPAVANARSMLLKQICGEVELYLNARQARDVAAEVTRLSTHVRLLEELAGDIDVESVSWNLVNFAREAVDCERVCLFIASHYDRALSEDPLGSGSDREFALQACSGLKQAHPRSEQAMTLQRVAQKLTQMSLAESPRSQAPATAGQPEAASPEAKDVNGAAVKPAPVNGAKPASTELSLPPAAAPNAPRTRPQLTLVMRDPAKVATRPEEINDYFDLMPMNWATVIPLFDRDDRVCGIILFEGVKVDQKLSTTLKPMIDLAVSAGRTLGTSLYLDQHRSMRWARSVVTARQRFVTTPTRRKLMSFGLPMLLLAAILCIPIPYHVNGDASVLAVKQNTLPALVGARLVEVLVREGETVKAGQVLARFDTQEIQRQIDQSENDQQRALLESDSAIAAGNEAVMTNARLNADKAAAAIDKWRFELQQAELRAPFDGIALGAQTLSTRVGEILRTGEPALQVVDPQDWQVKVHLRERDLIFLDEQLRKTGPVAATVRLAADPSKKYALALTSPNQLAYGLDMNQGEYQFTAVLPMKGEAANPEFLKAGFNGRVSFDTGHRPIAYVLFKDFFQFLTVRFF